MVGHAVVHLHASGSAVCCRGNERGTARPEVLQSLLKTTDRVVQEIDSVEYGLTDIQARPTFQISFVCAHLHPWLVTIRPLSLCL